MIPLFKKMAQNIAQSASDVIGCGVLVTDEKGTIIGCNDKNRIGKFHAPSKLVIAENRSLITTSEDAMALEDVKPGYTLPILFFDKVVGTVSIAGQPDDVARFGLLVQKQAEIMLREQAFLESNLLKERALRDVVENVAAFDKGNGNAELIMMQARDLGYNLSKFRTAMTVVMKKWGSESAEYGFQRMVRELRAVFPNPRNLICPQGNYRVTVFFQTNSESSLEESSAAAIDMAEKFVANAADKGIAADIAVGVPSLGLAGLGRSLRTSRDSMRIARQLGGAGVINAEHYTAEALLDLLPQLRCKEFAETTLKDLLGRKDYDEIKETFMAWCESPFASAEVAERLSMHRNSLQYRLKKIRTLTGKDPWNFKDAICLFVAFTLTDIK